MQMHEMCEHHGQLLRTSQRTTVEFCLPCSTETLQPALRVLETLFVEVLEDPHILGLWILQRASFLIMRSILSSTEQKKAQTKEVSW